MRKKILSILTLLCLTVTGAWADDDSGSCGTSVTYSYEESTHTQTISGRNIAMQQMAQTVHDLVERLPEEHKQHTDNPSSDNSNNNINN